MTMINNSLVKKGHKTAVKYRNNLKDLKLINDREIDINSIPSYNYFPIKKSLDRDRRIKFIMWHISCIIICHGTFDRITSKL